MNRTERLHDLGRRRWLDNIDRPILAGERS
jgi:hypothetical protein